MPFVSLPYLDYIGPVQRAQLQAAHTPIGYHPETRDELLIPTVDRYSGTYVTGVQGSGKSGLLQNMIAADMQSGHTVIVIDPHGDLIKACLSHVPPNRLPQTFLLDLEDEAYPFGVNLFSTGKLTSSIDQARTVDRIMHTFAVLWEDVLSQQHLPRYLRAATITLLANPGATLVDMHSFLLDGSVRYRMLQNVTDPTVRQFWQTQYDNQSPAEQARRVQPLIGRLESLFMGRSLIRNIVGQRKNTINWRKAIEQKQIVFIKLPVKTVEQDSRLLGTILLVQISNAVFSFGDVPEAKRPGVSLYVDEVQHFATPDFTELYTEGRKYGSRITIAHQYRNQLPPFLRDSTMTARTKICFQLKPDDGREMAPVFPSTEATVQLEDIDPHPVHYLLTKTPDEPMVQTFVDTYLRPLQGHKRGAGRVEIELRGSAPSLFEVWNGGRFDNPRIADPTPYLDSLLYQVMTSGNPTLDIPPEAVLGFSNSGKNFYKQARSLTDGDPDLTMQARFPKALVVETANGGLRWTRKPESGLEQLYHFIFYLREVMEYLAENPIGKKSTTSAADVAKMLTSLPRRAAFVRSGDTVGVIYTHDTNPSLPREALYERAKAVLLQTRARYCRPRAEVEQLFVSPGDAQPPNQPLSRWEEIEP